MRIPVLIVLLLQKGYTKRRVRAVLKFIDWIIRLPGELAEKLDVDVKSIEEGEKMAYVTSFEKIAMEKAHKEDAQRMLEMGADISFISKATGLSVEQIQELKEEKEK